MLFYVLPLSSVKKNKNKTLPNILYSFCLQSLHGQKNISCPSCRCKLVQSWNTIFLFTLKSTLFLSHCQIPKYSQKSRTLWKETWGKGKCIRLALSLQLASRSDYHHGIVTNFCNMQFTNYWLLNIWYIKEKYSDNLPLLL